MCITAGTAGFLANSATTGEAERESKIDDAMDNLVAIMSSNKGQVETLAASNASLLLLLLRTRLPLKNSLVKITS